MVQEQGTARRRPLPFPPFAPGRADVDLELRRGGALPKHFPWRRGQLQHKRENARSGGGNQTWSLLRLLPPRRPWCRRFGPQAVVHEESRIREAAPCERPLRRLRLTGRDKGADEYLILVLLSLEPQV